MLGGHTWSVAHSPSLGGVAGKSAFSVSITHNCGPFICHRCSRLAIDKVLHGGYGQLMFHPQNQKAGPTSFKQVTNTQGHSSLEKYLLTRHLGVRSGFL